MCIINYEKAQSNKLLYAKERQLILSKIRNILEFFALNVENVYEATVTVPT